MKILHLLYESEGDYFGIGGVGVRAYEIYRRLKDRHDITLLCKRYPGARDSRIQGLRHIYAGAESRSLTVTLLAYARQASRYVREHGADYDIIVEEFSPAIPTFLDSYHDRVVVLQAQGYTGAKYFAKYNPLYSTVLYLAERIRPSRYRTIILVSEASRKRYGLDDSEGRRISVISNGIPEGLLGVRPGSSKYILYMGRIDIHTKGLDILLRAYRKFRNCHEDIGLVIAGDGRDRKRFSALINGLPEKARSGIRQEGWVDGEDKTRLLSNALLVVAPSRHETQGIVTLEAMACGKALVVSDIPELGHAVTCGAGISFRSEDASALAAALTSLMNGHDLQAMGQRGREWVKDYTWDSVALRFEAYLLSVLDNARAVPPQSL